jgi:uncharacterized protein
LSQVWRELKARQEDGSLFTSPLDFSSYNPPAPLLQALCLHVAHDCNLRCRYCFADGGPFGGQRGLMPLEVGRAALDFLMRASGPRRTVEVDFFGGEPLLNFSVVASLLNYGQEKAREAGKKIRFTLTTNGVGLTSEIEEFLNTRGVSVILSLDGRPEVNDANRFFPGGEGSYSYVMPKLQSFVQNYPQLDYWIRGTYTRQNLDFARDVLHLVSLGFKNISLEPVIAGPEQPYSLRRQDLPRIRDEYQYLAGEFLRFYREGRPFKFFHFILDPEGGPCLSKRLSGCGAGTSYLAVTPDGQLFPCHQFVGQREFCLGDVYSGIKRSDLQEQFRLAHIGCKEGCRCCWARYYCSGGCHAAAFAAHRDLLRPDEVACAIQQIRTEAALYIQAKIRLKI